MKNDSPRAIAAAAHRPGSREGRAARGQVARPEARVAELEAEKRKLATEREIGGFNRSVQRVL